MLNSPTNLPTLNATNSTRYHAVPVPPHDPEGCSQCEWLDRIFDQIRQETICNQARLRAKRGEDAASCFSCGAGFLKNHLHKTCRVCYGYTNASGDGLRQGDGGKAPRLGAERNAGSGNAVSTRPNWYRLSVEAHNAWAEHWLQTNGG